MSYDRYTKEELREKINSSDLVYMDNENFIIAYEADLLLSVEEPSNFRKAIYKIKPRKIAIFLEDPDLNYFYKRVFSEKTGKLLSKKDNRVFIEKIFKTMNEAVDYYQKALEKELPKIERKIKELEEAKKHLTDLSYINALT